MSSLPTPAQARQRLESRLRALAPTETDLTAALGCQLTAGIRARWDHPRADVSAMDGYACRGDAEAGATLREVAEVAAGDPAVTAIGSDDTVVAIMTGGWVPRGADRVVPFENTTALDGVRLRLERPVEAGANIRRRGEVYRAGETLVAAGTVLDAVHLALAAGEGHERLEVIPRPRAALLVTGDEVRRTVDGDDLPLGALLDSHTPLVEGLCRSADIDLQTLGVAADRAADLAQNLAAADADILITTGGVSAGRHDLVPEVAEKLGFETLVHRVAMQPGKPMLIAVRARPAGDDQWLIGLPGNPAAVLVGFHLFVVPLARGLGVGVSLQTEPELAVALETAVRPHALRTRYLPAVLIDTPTPPSQTSHSLRLLARLRTSVGSHDLRPFAGADVLLEVEPGERELPPGTKLRGIPLHRGLKVGGMAVAYGPKG